MECRKKKKNRNARDMWVSTIQVHIQELHTINNWKPTKSCIDKLPEMKIKSVFIAYSIQLSHNHFPEKQAQSVFPDFHHHPHNLQVLWTA